MADKVSIQQQIEEARRKLENRPEWVRRNTHLEGFDSHVEHKPSSGSSEQTKSPAQKDKK